MHSLVKKKYLPFEAFDEEEKKKKKKVVGEQKTIGPIKEQSSRNSFVRPSRAKNINFKKLLNVLLKTMLLDQFKKIKSSSIIFHLMHFKQVSLITLNIE